MLVTANVRLFQDSL